MIEHRLFLVLSGSLPFIDGEFHRLWQDTNAYTTCQQLIESEEIQYLRAATLRNHNRVAARVADTLGLPVRCFIDSEDPSGKKRSAHPMTMTMRNDIEFDHHTRRVHLVDIGTFLNKSLNGVLYQMHSARDIGFFQGPPITQATTILEPSSATIMTLHVFPPVVLNTTTSSQRVGPLFRVLTTRIRITPFLSRRKLSRCAHNSPMKSSCTRSRDYPSIGTMKLSD
jgi:hypothetical protein